MSLAESLSYERRRYGPRYLHNKPGTYPGTVRGEIQFECVARESPIMLDTVLVENR